MNLREAHLNELKSNLNDRQLWFDGSITVPSNHIIDYVFLLKDHHSKVFVDEITPDIDQYNKIAQQQLTIKHHINEIFANWVFSDPSYETLDVEQLIYDLLEEEIQKQSFNSAQRIVRKRRVKLELKLFKQFDPQYNIIRVLLNIINTLSTHGILWGTGRGSATSSYILYLIKLHDVDSVKYSLDVKDFFHTKIYDDMEKV